MQSVVFILLWHCAVARGTARAGVVDDLTLRLLLDEVVLYAVHVLLGSDLAVAEGVTDGEGHAVDGHFDIGVTREVLSAAAALDVQVATFVEAHDTLHAQCELVVEE